MIHSFIYFVISNIKARIIILISTYYGTSLQSEIPL